MCQVMTKPQRHAVKSPLSAVPTPQAEELLREAAFVLQMTQRVKDAIRDGTPLSTAEAFECSAP